MLKTSAQRKALETKRKAEKGLKRRSFWLDEKSINIIEEYKIKNNLKTNDEAIAKLIQQTQN